MSQPAGTVADLEAVLISLHVAEKQKLLIMLTSDGTINRQGGSDSPDSSTSLFIGMTDRSVFQALATQVDREWFTSAGRRLEFPDARGEPTLLRLVFKTSAAEYPLEFLYGLTSGGLPADIGNFVLAAVRLTDPWYQSQKQIVANQAKPWWKFW